MTARELIKQLLELDNIDIEVMRELPGYFPTHAAPIREVEVHRQQFKPTARPHEHVVLK